MSEKIQNINFGMSWEQVVPIINQLINAVNSLSGALGSVLASGKIDYNSLEHRPNINSVLLEGDLSTNELNINITADAKADCVNAGVNAANQTMEKVEKSKLDANFSTLIPVDGKFELLTFCVNDELGNAKRMSMKEFIQFIQSNPKSI